LLKEWRDAREMSHWEAAKALDVDPRYLQRYEKGGVPGLENALKIAYATDGLVPATAWNEAIDE
ncbi:MAG: helix-turn-helix domain-containing protein, partial [Planctomycetota bacterium]